MEAISLEEGASLPVQLAFDGLAVQEKLRPFRDAFRSGKSRRVPVDVLRDICNLGYQHDDDRRPEPFTQTGRYSDQLTSVLVQAGGFLVIANWAKVRRAGAASQESIDVVDVQCEDADIWWALLAEVREIKQRDWGRRLYLAFRHLPADVIASLSLREWEAVLDIDHTSLWALHKPLPADLEARVLSGDLSIWSAYPRVPRTFWAEGSESPASAEPPHSQPGPDAYDSSASVREAIEQAGLSRFINLTRCLRAPQAFLSGVRTLLANVDQQQQLLATAAGPRRRRTQKSRC